MKKLLMLLVVLVVLAISAAVGVGYVLFSSTGASTWLAQYIRDIAQTYLVPTIDFDEFDLVDLKTARMSNTTFTAPDGTRVIECDTFEITFAGIPRQGQPIRIERIAFVNPTLRLIASDEEGTTFKGLVPFVKNTSEPEQGGVQDEFRLSNLLAIRTLAVENGAFEYDDGSGSPMVIDGLELELEGTPTGSPGEYALDVDIDRAPVVEIVYDGSVNIDTFAATIDSLAINASLDEGDYSAFPPQIQQVLEQADARGELKLTASGALDPTDPVNASNLNARADLTGLNIGFGEYRLPIEQGEASVTLAGGTLTQGPIFAQAMGGRAEVTGLTMNLADQSVPGSLSYTVSQVDLRQALRNPAMPDPPIAGMLNVNGSASFQAAAIPGSLAGPGTLSLREARLYELPVLSDLADRALDVWSRAESITELFSDPAAAFEAVRTTESGAFSDAADVSYTLGGQGVRLTQSTIETRVMKINATGNVAYDGELDLVADINPAGKVKDELSQLADRAVGGDTGETVQERVGGLIGELVRDNVPEQLQDATGGGVDQLIAGAQRVLNTINPLRFRIQGPAASPSVESAAVNLP